MPGPPKDLALIEGIDLSGVPPSLVHSTVAFAAAARSDATIKAYADSWRYFTAWCQEHGLGELPAAPPTVALYISAMAEAGRRPSYIARTLAAIAAKHREKNLPTPTQHDAVKTVHKGIRRTLGVAEVRKAPLVPEVLRPVLAMMPPDLRGLRDRAILLLGFGAALRRSEIAALRAGDIAKSPEGLRVTIRRSKTDQTGRGDVVGIIPGKHHETCPVMALSEWMQASGRHGTAVLFPRFYRNGHLGKNALTGHAIARLIKAHVLAAGIDPMEFSGHSLRAGFATAAIRGGAGVHAVKRTTRHKSTAMLDRYVRESDVLRDNAFAQTGL